MKTLKKTLFALLLIGATTPVLAAPAVPGPSPVNSGVTVKMSGLQATGAMMSYRYTYNLVFHNTSASYASCDGSAVSNDGPFFRDLILPPGKDTVMRVHGNQGYEEWKISCHKMFPQPEQALPVPAE